RNAGRFGEAADGAGKFELHLGLARSSRIGAALAAELLGAAANPDLVVACHIVDRADLARLLPVGASAGHASQATTFAAPLGGGFFLVQFGLGLLLPLAGDLRRLVEELVGDFLQGRVLAPCAG